MSVLSQGCYGFAGAVCGGAFGGSTSGRVIISADFVPPMITGGFSGASGFDSEAGGRPIGIDLEPGMKVGGFSGADGGVAGGCVVAGDTLGCGSGFENI